MGCSVSKTPKVNDQVGIPISKKELDEIIKQRVDERIQELNLSQKMKFINKSASTRDLEDSLKILVSEVKVTRQNQTSSILIQENSQKKSAQINPEIFELSKIERKNIESCGTISEVENDFESLKSSELCAHHRVCDISAADEKSEISLHHDLPSIMSESVSQKSKCDSHSHNRDHVKKDETEKISSKNLKFSRNVNGKRNSLNRHKRNPLRQMSSTFIPMARYPR